MVEGERRDRPCGAAGRVGSYLAPTRGEGYQGEHYLEPELVGEEQRGALGGENDTRNTPEPPAEKGRLEGPLLGPQELDSWLVGTVRALQESMRDVQGRLQSLESMPMPPKQMPPPSARPRPLRLSGPTLIFFLLWPFIVQWLFRQFRTQKR